ncbi:DeoR/GlpR family DNA-binding transcription regulator [Cohnella rhizosphaerae]|uniref:DeoR/GlpR family DNA-binding transcription regulator n=1 Tax=Cohnella rhizosphaerae TaxID=1457232 RepID=A0A9X4KT20_9BACL|nr:DeoR/GlpR family DNA-binding transcription regulator [Cohnella rhizosphaerae]MDG0810450.1 DeoR/GlpR family DNA-binding transcription regulator [Cohnella rhizosphaerae]
MFASQRREEIYKLARDRQFISVAELSGIFQVSDVTIRSDLKLLEQQGKITKNYGGASIISEDVQPLSTTSQLLSGIKAAIAREAAALIEEGDSVFLDSSSTTILLADAIVGMSDVTVITNSIPIFDKLKEYRSGTMIGIAGTLSPYTQSFVGPFAEEMIAKLRVSKAFIAPKGLLPEGLRDTSVQEAAIRSKMMASADKVIVLADHSKFNNENVVFSICGFDKVRHVVTDQAPKAPFDSVLQQKGIEIRVANLT